MRRGLVIGGGGLPGLAWSAATLTALEKVTGWDPRTADVLLGTSQGSFVAAVLGSGVSTNELTRWYRLKLPARHPLRAKPEKKSKSRSSVVDLVPLPGSPTLVWRTGLSMTGLSGFLPKGRGSLEPFLAPVRAMGGADGWVDHPATWVVATDYDSGERVCFGRPCERTASILDATRASCSIPGVYPPHVIGDRRYVDGGVHSTTSADLLLDADLDEVVILAPMVRRRTPVPRSPIVAGEYLAGLWAGAKLDAERQALEEAGVRARVFVPTPDELAMWWPRSGESKRGPALFEAALANGPDRVAETFAS